MAKDVPDFMKIDGDALLYNEDGELIYFVPEQHFDSKIAIEYGEYISLLGEFNYGRFKNGKLIGQIKPFYFPSIFVCKPSDTSYTDSATLNKMYPKAFIDDGTQYRQIIFHKGDQLVNSVHIPQILGNAEQMFKLFLISGRIPNTIPYDELHYHFKDSMNLNGEDYGLNLQLFGMVISEVCRDKDNIEIPFRLGKNIDKDFHSYRSIPITQNPHYVDPYSALTSQYFDEAIMSANLLDGQNAEIPVEKVFTTR